eukprot:scaffold11478_cov103-Isochrysis_galbana.AAC.3
MLFLARILLLVEVLLLVGALISRAVVQGVVAEVRLKVGRKPPGAPHHMPHSPHATTHSPAATVRRPIPSPSVRRWSVNLVNLVNLNPVNLVNLVDFVYPVCSVYLGRLADPPKAIILPITATGQLPAARASLHGTNLPRSPARLLCPVKLCPVKLCPVKSRVGAANPRRHPRPT